jgi:adenylate cyclase
VEKEIPIEEAEKCYFVKKESSTNRFEVKIGKHTYEVDEFYGANESLTVAEIESESETFTKPNWLGIEVTNDNRYYNSNLS